MLDKFYEEKKYEIENLYERDKSGKLNPEKNIKRSNCAQSIKKNNVLSIIAEYKQSSPSKGIIRKNLSVEDVVETYENGGASALSILTEEKWFSGNIDFLDRAFMKLKNKSIPILRKDFIYDRIQIKATAATNASAILLITRCMKDVSNLKNLLQEADYWGIQCVTEVFDQYDLEMAREVNANIIQVNARDLNSLKVDKLACLNLIKKNPPKENEVWIAASGMETAEDLKLAHKSGYNAALIGTALMRNENPGEFLRQLLMKNAY